MHITTNRSELRRELLYCRDVVPTKANIQALGCVKITATTGWLELAATDLDIAARSAVEAKVEEEGAVCVDSRRFTDIVKSLDADDVVLRLDEDLYLNIACGSARFKLATIPAEDFPAMPDLKQDAAGGAIQDITLSTNLAELLPLVEYAATESDARYFLAGVVLAIEDGAAELVATDGHRLAYVRVPGASGSMREILPVKALKAIRSMMDPKIRSGVSYIEFSESSGRTLWIKKVTGEFPQYRSVVSQTPPLRAVIPVKAFAAAVRQAALLANERSLGVRLRVSAGSMIEGPVLALDGSCDFGVSESELSIEYDGAEILMALNAKYILDVLDTMRAEKVSIELSTPDAPSIFRPVGDAGEVYEYTAVVMPMRL